jgi:hypothetical protein
MRGPAQTRDLGGAFCCAGDGELGVRFVRGQRSKMGVTHRVMRLIQHLPDVYVKVTYERHAGAGLRSDPGTAIQDPDDRKACSQGQTSA